MDVVCLCLYFDLQNVFLSAMLSMYRLRHVRSAHRLLNLSLTLLYFLEAIVNGTLKSQCTIVYFLHIEIELIFLY